jgi:hypothetical protein
MSDDEIVGTSILLLIAGHETTVNLIANGMLTFLRHPDVLKRLRQDPEMIIHTVEELLRYEPSVHLVPWRITLDDIELAGTVIPQGAPVILALAAANRDPEHVPHPDRFDPDRQVEHLTFSSGIHYCFGAAGPARGADRAESTREPTSQSAARHRPAPLPAEPGPPRPPPPPRRVRRTGLTSTWRVRKGAARPRWVSGDSI